MTERNETRSKLRFTELDPAHRVLAILAYLPDPLSKELAVTLSGIKVSELNERELNEINSVFTGEGVIAIESNQQKYTVNDEVRTHLARHVDLTSINHFVTNLSLSDLLSADTDLSSSQ